MKFEQYKCDVCGALKAETNHWWVLLVNQFGFHLAPMEYDGGPDPAKQHLCGQECAVKKLAEFMNAGKVA